MQQIAKNYIRRGWIVLPIHAGEKRPQGNEWQTLRLKEPQAMAAFLRAPSIGVHLGPSGLIDIDLDCAEAVQHAAKLLPATATFGRESSPVSHWVYEGTAEYKKFVDPIDGACLLEIRAGEGKQTVFPGSTHPSGEKIDWTDGDKIQTAPEDLRKRAGMLAQVAWLTKHGEQPLPEKVEAWGEPDAPRAAAPANTQMLPAEVRVDKPDQELIDMLAEEAPEKGSRHDYRLKVAGVLRQNGFAEAAAETMLVEAMAKIGGSADDAIAAVRDTYRAEHAIAGAGSLIGSHESGKKIVAAIEEKAMPEIDELQDWTERLYESCLGGNVEPLQDKEFIRELAQMMLRRDHRIHTIWAKLKDAGWMHLKGLQSAAEDYARSLKKNNEAQEADLMPCQHPEAAGMFLPAGAWISEDRKLFAGEDLITAGQFEILAKCPSDEGVQTRIAFRSSSAQAWSTTVVPYKFLIDTKHVTALAGHGLNCSSLEAAQIVAYCRDFIATNEKLLDRPIATSTGWHESGAFVWGRNILQGPEDLKAEFAIDNQIGTQYVAALHSAGDREKSLAALRQTAEKTPAGALCLAASLSACWTQKLQRPCVGVHLGGVGGTGKTRTLKIAASAWGSNGTSGGNSATGTIAGANSTVRAMEIAAAVRNDLPFFVSDMRPIQGLPEVLHGILNSDPRARATASGGSNVGAQYRCGALITEGELNVKSLTSRQGFHRRVIELEPDADQMQLLWDLGEICSENYGFLGPEFVALGPPSEARFAHWREELKELGAELALNASTLMAIAEHCAGLLGADLDKWHRHILKGLVLDREASRADGGSQTERAEHELEEILLELAPQIAGSREETSIPGIKPWIGFRDDNGTHVVAVVLRKALKERGHDAITSVLAHLAKQGAIKSAKAPNVTIGGRRIRCFTILPEKDLTEPAESGTLAD